PGPEYYGPPSSPGGSIAKSTGTRSRLETATPSSIAGLNLHFLAAATASSSNTPTGSALSTTTDWTSPRGSTSTTSTTFPSILCSTAWAGYLGASSMRVPGSDVAGADPAGCAAQAVNATAEASRQTVAVPARRRRNEGRGCLSIAILSLSGWP